MNAFVAAYERLLHARDHRPSQEYLDDLPEQERKDAYRKKVDRLKRGVA